MLRHAISKSEEAAKRKETEAVIPPQELKTDKTTPSGKPNFGKSKRDNAKEDKSSSLRKNLAELAESDSEDELLREEERTQTRMQTRNMRAKHVPVDPVNEIMLKDLNNYREPMKDPRVEHWEEAMRISIDALERNDT